MPRVYGNWPGSSSPRWAMSLEVYSGSRGMPEIVDVSIPSSRVDADSKSSFQTCLGSRARTFTLNPLSRPVQDLLGRGVRRALFQQALSQGGVLGQGTTHPIASDFS